MINNILSVSSRIMSNYDREILWRMTATWKLGSLFYHVRIQNWHFSFQKKKEMLLNIILKYILFFMVFRK